MSRREGAGRAWEDPGVPGTGRGWSTGCLVEKGSLTAHKQTQYMSHRVVYTILRLCINLFSSSVRWISWLRYGASEQLMMCCPNSFCCQATNRILVLRADLQLKCVDSHKINQQLLWTTTLKRPTNSFTTTTTNSEWGWITEFCIVSNKATQLHLNLG